MVDTLGKKLQQARLEKQISLGEASRATKMRQERISDLENDNYTNFPNLAYAKSFLLIYAKFLKLDVSEFTDAFQNTSQIGTDDYEYLTRTPQKRASVVRYKPKRSLMPFVLAVATLVLISVIMFLVITFQRLGNLDQLSKKDQPGESSTSIDPTPVPAIAPSIAPVPVSVEGEISPVNPATEILKAEPVQPSSNHTNVLTAVAPPTINEVELRPLNKTWVKIQKEDLISEPIFEDWLYPDAPPLTFRGTKFRIEIADKDAVEIRKNGEIIPYEVPGITIE